MRSYYKTNSNYNNNNYNNNKSSLSVDKSEVKQNNYRERVLKPN